MTLPSDRTLSWHTCTPWDLIVAAFFDSHSYATAPTHAIDVNHFGVLLGAGAIEETRRGASRQRAVELARRALASPIGDARDRLYCVNAIHALALAGEVEDAETALRAGIEDARRAGDRFASAAYHVWRGLLRVERGELLARRI
jgi:hypothetical protein